MSLNPEPSPLYPIVNRIRIQQRHPFLWLLQGWDFLRPFLDAIVQERLQPRMVKNGYR